MNTYFLLFIINISIFIYNFIHLFVLVFTCEGQKIPANVVEKNKINILCTRKLFCKPPGFRDREIRRSAWPEMLGFYYISLLTNKCTLL